MVPLLLALFLVSIQGTGYAGFHIQVPQTSPRIIIDGSFSLGEWQQSKRIVVPGVAALYFLRSDAFVYIAIKYLNSPSGIVDLYLSPRKGEIYDLHASAKLGERQLRGDSFPDWIWWNNHDWVANTIRVDSFEKRTFIPAPVREFQVRRSRFASDVWYLRFELAAMDASNQILSTSVFPAGTSDKSTAGWLQLDLK